MTGGPPEDAGLEPGAAAPPPGGGETPAAPPHEDLGDRLLRQTLPFPTGPEPSPRTALETVRDNLEAIAFALVLALLLRHFAIEVFKIPTSSMEPTLFGDHPGSPGDRILVDKTAYLLRDPARWDVVVFHYPLDWSRNFIKRVVGRPGEALRIERGDVWTGTWDGRGTPSVHPSRKPRRVREQLYVPLYPPSQSKSFGPATDWWREEPRGAAPFRVLGHGRFVYDGDATGSAGRSAPWASLRYGYAVRDTDTRDRDPRSADTNYLLVPDVRLRCTVVADGEAEVEITWDPGDGRLHAIRLATEGRTASEARTRNASRAIKERLVPGRPLDVELESVDGDLRAWVDGDEVVVLPDEIPLAEAARLEQEGEGTQRQRLEITVRGARVEFRDVRLDHDLYYTNHRADPSNRVPPRETPYVLGSDEFFMLGDNTRSSSDSRRWRASGTRLKDGRTIWYDPAERDWSWTGQGPDRRKQVTDIEGVTRRWTPEEEEESAADSREMPVVKRDRIIGRAWFALVFWPLDKAWSRVRFIH